MHDPPRVLVIDDDAEIVRAVRVRLGAAGYDVVAAGDAEQGLTLARHSRPDVIVMDIQLPRKDGLTALAEMREQPATNRTPIVMLSACSSERKHALELGARFFLDKPFQSKSLLAAIENSMGRRKEEEEVRP